MSNEQVQIEIEGSEPHITPLDEEEEIWETNLEKRFGIKVRLDCNDKPFFTQDVSDHVACSL